MKIPAHSRRVCAGARALLTGGILAGALLTVPVAAADARVGPKEKPARTFRMTQWFIIEPVGWKLTGGWFEPPILAESGKGIKVTFKSVAAPLQSEVLTLDPQAGKRPAAMSGDRLYGLPVVAPRPNLPRLYSEWLARKLALPAEIQGRETKVENQTWYLRVMKTPKGHQAIGVLYTPSGGSLGHQGGGVLYAQSLTDRESAEAALADVEAVLPHCLLRPDWVPVPAKK